jgi:cytochrome c
MDGDVFYSQKRMARALLWVAVVAVLAGVGSYVLKDRFLANPSPAILPGVLERMAHPSALASHSPTTDASDQATHGAEVYSEHCITCHGDRGQGLTLEWRLTWDPEHQNCNRPNCHGLNHPPEGFYLPNMYAPAIVGPDALEEFQTAQDLFGFISTRMPFQEPGVLSQEDYWALAAFLLRQNGVALPGADLGAGNASRILLHSHPVQPTEPAAADTQ